MYSDILRIPLHMLEVQCSYLLYSVRDRPILGVLLGQYKGRNMLSINVRAKGNTVRIRQCSFLSSLFKPVAPVQYEQLRKI